jgi:hypothetical protein
MLSILSLFLFAFLCYSFVYTLVTYIKKELLKKCNLIIFLNYRSSGSYLFCLLDLWTACLSHVSLIMFLLVLLPLMISETIGLH